MGSSDLGTQTILFDFKNPGTSQSFNKLNYKIHSAGIYDGATLTKINDTTVEVSTLNCFITDESLQLGTNISTAAAVQVTVDTSNIYVVLRMSWANVENNFMDFFALPFGSIQTGDLIIGRCVFDGATLTGFDLSRRSEPPTKVFNDQKDAFKVIPQEPPTAFVSLSSGNAIIRNKYVEFSGTTISLTNTTLGRIDLIYIDSDGTSGVIEGSDSGSPVEPDFPKDVLVLGKVTRGASATFVTGDQITNFLADRYAYKIPSIKSISAPYTATLIDDLLLSTGTNTITLPASASSKNIELIIKNVGTGLITVDANSTELIDNSETIQLKENEFITIRCDGTGWKIIGENRKSTTIVLKTANFTILDSEKNEIFVLNPNTVSQYGTLVGTLPTGADNQNKVFTFQHGQNEGLIQIIPEGSEKIEFHGKQIDYVYLFIPGDGISLYWDDDQGIWKIKPGTFLSILDLGQINTADWTLRELGMATFAYDNKSNTASFEGMVITEATSLNTWVVLSDTGGTTGTLICYRATGTGYATNNRVLTSSSSATADVNEPSGSTKDVDSNIVHNTGISSQYIDQVEWYSTTGADNDNFVVNGKAEAGIAVNSNRLAIDNNSFKFQTSGNGLGGWIDDAGNIMSLTTQDYYYKYMYIFRA